MLEFQVDRIQTGPSLWEGVVGFNETGFRVFLGTPLFVVGP